MSFKKKLLLGLNLVWSKIIPVLLVIGFYIGVFFAFWDILGWSLAVSIIVTVILCAISVFTFGKLIKIF